jgi:hypothetical protein
MVGKTVRSVMQRFGEAPCVCRGRPSPFSTRLVMSTGKIYLGGLPNPPGKFLPPLRPRGSLAVSLSSSFRQEFLQGGPRGTAREAFCPVMARLP